MHRLRLIPIFISLAALGSIVAGGCGKKHDADHVLPGAGASGAAAASGKPGTPTAPATSTSTPTVGPEAASQSIGCALPADGVIKHDWTLVTGCKLTVEAQLRVEGSSTLTLQPGVTLAFGSAAYLEVRYGKLVAQGTADAPVVLTSKSRLPSKGDWGGLLFRDRPAAGNVLDHVTIEYAGRGTYFGPGVIAVRAGAGKLLAITNTTLQHNAGVGIYLLDQGAGFAKFEHNTFDDDDGDSLHLDGDAVGTMGAGNVLGAPVHVAGGVTRSASWPAIDAPYVIEGRLKVASGSDPVTLTLPAKATVKFNADAMLAIGEGAGGGLVAHDVTFSSTSDNPSAGDWPGLLFYEKTTATTIDHCTFEYAGKKTPWSVGVVVFHDGPPTDFPSFKLTNSTFRNVVGPAIRSGSGACGALAAPASGNTIDRGPLCAKDATPS